MSNAPQSITLGHKISWDLRAVAITFGGVAVALPFLVGDGAMGRLQSAAWVLGGLLVIVIFALVKSTAITADEEGLTVRQSGLFGKSVEKLLPGEIVKVEVMPISTRVHGTSYCVAVKLKGRRPLFMGENHKEQGDAEAEARLFKAVAGFSELAK